jgi:hypothetical protein
MTVKKFSGIRKFSTAFAGAGGTSDVPESRLVKALAEDLFLLSDSEVEDQLRADGEDSEAIVRRMQASIASLSANATDPSTVAPADDVSMASMSIAEMRGLIERAIAHPAVPARLVHAFRASNVESKAELRALVDELSTLGVFGPFGDK